MIHFEADQPSQIFTLTYSGDVRGEELSCVVEEIKSLIEEMKPGFRLLTDLGKLVSMEPSCAVSIVEIMKLADERGVAEVVRVVPDAQKDIGFMVMSRFHYKPSVRLLTYENLQDALESLSS